MLKGKNLWPAFVVLTIAVLIGIFVVITVRKSINNPSSKISVSLTSKTKNSQINNNANESAIFQPDTQTYTNSKLGISFSYSSSWQRPLVVENQNTKEIKLGNDLSIYIGENIIKDDYKNKDKKTKLIKRQDIAVLIEYKDDTRTENIAEQIVDTLIITEPKFEPTDKPNSAVTEINYLSPTARPTPDPNQKGECTYGCVSENKFNK